jgi:hypothetical protein
MTHNRPHLAWLVGLAVAAVTAPAAHGAGLRPDDRADIRGAGVVISSYVVRPDDRTGIHGVGAASFYTPQALQAEGQRWEAMARAYQRPSATTGSQSAGFDWADAGIGAAGGLGFALIGVALLVGTRRSRRTEVAL